jgi:hypothetical protein
MLKNYCAVLSIFTIPVFVHYTSQLKPQQQPSRTQQQTGRIDKPLDTSSIVEDLSKGAIFRFQIAASLPLFTFKIIPDVRDNENGFPQSTLQDIEVFKGDSDQPLQHLTGCDWEEMETPPRYGDWFRADDVNFDGYQDIYLLTQWGATGNQYGCVWLYDPTTGHFEYNKEFSELSRYWLDTASKTVRTFSTGGMAGAVHTASQYKVENNRPLLVWSETQDWDPDKKQFHCVLQERQNGVMVTTRDVWGKSGETPCETPLDWFQSTTATKKK